MKQRLWSLALGLVLILAALSACTPADPATNTGSDDAPDYDPLPFIRLEQTYETEVTSKEGSLVVPFKNNSTCTVITGDTYSIPLNDAVAKTGSVKSYNSLAGTGLNLSLGLTDAQWAEGKNQYLVSVPYTAILSDGSRVSGVATCTVTVNHEVAPPPPPQDILKTPIGELNAEKQQELAQYLFENYLPCSFGLYDSPEKITSASIWASIEALNSKIDGDTSEATRTLADATAKATRYYPNATFNPEEVRVYNKNTQTFMGVAMPVQPLECILLSFEVKDGQITLYYEDKPDATDPEAEIITYATTLKNSTEEGYFSFVSSVRTDAVG